MIFYLAYGVIVATGWVLVSLDARTEILRGRGDEVTWWMTCAANVLGIAVRASGGMWGSVAVYGIAAGFCAWMAWRRRRKDRRRAASLLGAKSRALRAAIVKRAREAARPRTVLRPSLKGAS